MAGFADDLIDVLREQLGTDSIDYLVPPTPLPGGAFSEVFQLELSGAPEPLTGPLVLRRYPMTTSPSVPLLERAVTSGLTGTGVPAPPVLLAHIGHDVRGQMFTIVPRLDGRAFLRGVRWDQFARDLPRLLLSWGKTAARVLADLHAIDPSVVRDAAANDGLDEDAISTGRHLVGIEQRLSALGHGGVSDGLAWLRAHEPSTPTTQAIVHGDLWPGNVLMVGSTVTGVVDWDRAAVGDPALDVGFAKAGLGLMPAPFPPPPPASQAVHAAGLLIARDLHREYRRLRPIEDARVDYYEALRCFLELSFVIEHRARRAGGTEPTSPAPHWENGSGALAQRFTAITAVPLRLPPPVS